MTRVPKACEKHILFYGDKFPTNRFIENFMQPTYKSDMCPLNM
jgi:hypothetical protein